MIDYTHFLVTGATAEAFERHEKEHQAAWDACRSWVREMFGERSIYGRDRYFCVALAVIPNEIVPKGLRIKEMTVSGKDGLEQASIYVPDRRTKVGRDIAKRMESFTRPSISDAAGAATNGGDATYMVAGRDGKTYFTYFKIHKIKDAWYCHVPTRALHGKDKPSGRVDEGDRVTMSANCQSIAEWEWQKLVEENKDELGDDGDDA